MKTVIYARQSRTREGSESLETQVEVCRQAAERFGYEVVAELVEPPSTSQGVSQSHAFVVRYGPQGP
jgi:DNA invertase Pin-like site-specific DNA recombinase